MSYRYHSKLRELMNAPKGVPPAEVLTGILDKISAFAAPLHEAIPDLPMAEGTSAL